jgi:hypothetical protein
MNTTVTKVDKPVLFLEPAYGRYYTSQEAALKDWNSGKDFKISGGPYCSKRDIKQMYEITKAVFIDYGYGVVEV